MKEFVYYLLTNGYEVFGILLFFLHYVIIGLGLLGISWVAVKIWEKINDILFN